MRGCLIWIVTQMLLSTGASAAPEDSCHDPASRAVQSPATTTVMLARADELTSAGAEAFRRGAFQRACIAWQEALEIYRGCGSSGLVCAAARRLAAAYQCAGMYDQAFATLNSVLNLAANDSDRMNLLAAMGTLQGYRGKPDALSLLNEAFGLAVSSGDAVGESAIRNDRGNLRVNLAAATQPSARARAHSDAEDDYSQSAKLAHDCGDMTLLAKARTNLVRSRILSDRTPPVAAQLDDAFVAVNALPDSYEKAHLLISLGESFEALAGRSAPADNALLRRAFDTYREAIQVATRIGSDRAACYAWGYQGRLYESQHQLADALAATRKAVFLAQKLNLSDALYRWEWQLARIDHAAGRTDAAIAAYGRSIDAVKKVRNDIALFGPRATGQGFREAVAPVFYGQADLLLRQDRPEEARQVIEDLKGAELEDYFQDECIDLLNEQRVDISKVLKSGEAILYVIPLEDRTELLLSLAGRPAPKRFVSKIEAPDLNELARTFRVQLTKDGSYECTISGGKLYEKLVRPVLDTLRAEKVDTLVFVPDGELRTIPLAALFDEQTSTFLIEEFAVAVSPGLNLSQTSDRQRTKRRVRVLVAGLSEARPGFSALQYVPIELDQIQALYQPMTLEDSDFTKVKFSNEIERRTYTIVHIASHGQFNPEIEKTFLLTADPGEEQRLYLNDLEKLIYPSQFRNQPLDLLTLSACETAKGADSARAALGLAGVAVKAGARSAMATLWRVNDESTSILVGEFYSALRDDPTLSKAKALQRAQLRLLKPAANQKTERYLLYEIPYYWAGFEIIGDWL